MPRSGWLAVGASAAAFAVSAFGLPPAVALIAVAVAVGVVTERLGRAHAVRTAWRPAAVGAVAILLRSTMLVGPAAPAALPTGPGPWTFAIESLGSPRAGAQTGTVRLIDGPSARSGAEPGAGSGGLLLAATLPTYPTVGVGDRISATGSIRERPDSQYGAYLERIGAAGTLTARSMTTVPAPDDPRRTLEALRGAAGDTLAAALPEPEAGLAAGILVGLRDRVDRDLAAAFTTAGVSHVVAISGWNIAIVAACVAALAGGMRRRRRSVLTIVAVIAYVAFAGASASVVRAGVMAGVVLLARESGRAGQAATALGWAATLLLLADPGLVGDAGFQLSSLATGGLIAWATPLTDWLERVGRGRLPCWLAEGLGVSTAAQAATLPVVLASFGRLSIVSPLVNLAVVPLVPAVMAAGLVAGVGGALASVGLPSPVVSLIAVPGWVGLRAMVGIVDAAAALPFASVALDAPWDLISAVLALAAIVGIDRWVRGRRRPAQPGPVPSASATTPLATPVASGSRTTPGWRWVGVPRWAVLTLAAVVVMTGAIVASRSAGVARVSILDVGQGDGILVEGSRGGRLLVDGGPDPARLLVALDARIPPWDRRLDVVVLTHPHEDHVAGLARLLARYRVGRVFEPGMRGPGPGYAAWDRELDASGAPVRRGLSAGDTLRVDEVSMRVLWPLPGRVPLVPSDGGTAINNVSIVLLGSVGSARFLLAGDVEQAIDPSLLGDDLPHLDLLKVAHHGSATATTQAFVDAVRPRVAVASAGAGNPYGHPAPSTLARLRDAGARVFRTDLDGTVVATFRASGMDVHSEGGRPAALTIPRMTVAVADRGAGPATPSTKPPPGLQTARAAAFRCSIPTPTAMVALVARALLPASSTPSGVHEASERLGYHPAGDDDGAGGGLPPALPHEPRHRAILRTRRPTT